MSQASYDEATPKIRTALMRALELDNTLAEVHFSLAVLRTWTDWDWEGAEKAFIRAIELNPNYPEAHAYYSHYLMIMGRPEEALAETERARELDPSSVLFQFLQAVVMSWLERYDEAIALCRGVLAVAPEHGPCGPLLQQAQYRRGMENESFERVKVNFKTRLGQAAADALTRAHAEGGYLQAWRTAAELNYAAGNYGPAADFFLRVGDKEQAVECLKRKIERQNPNLPYDVTSKEWDEVREDPRFRDFFQDLRRRMNLPPS